MAIFKMRLWSTAIAAVALATAGTASLQAQATTLEVDPSQTHIEFTLGSVLHTVHGTFNLKSGVIRFDPSGKASGKIVVDTTSGDSGNKSRDRKMDREVLESQKYPEAVFIPDRIEGAIPSDGNFHLNMYGQFWLHGQAHEVLLPVNAQRTNGGLTATTQFIVPYIAWGLKNPSTLFLRVSKEVQIHVQTVVHFGEPAGVNGGS